MTKLEEVALSIWHERAKHFGEPPRPFVKDERWELCLSYARAAIEALQTGECICGKCGLRHGITLNDLGDDAGF